MPRTLKQPPAYSWRPGSGIRSFVRSWVPWSPQHLALVPAGSSRQSGPAYSPNWIKESGRGRRDRSRDFCKRGRPGRKRWIKSTGSWAASAPARCTGAVRNPPAHELLRLRRADAPETAPRRPEAPPLPRERSKVQRRTIFSAETRWGSWGEIWGWSRCDLG